MRENLDCTFLRGWAKTPQFSSALYQWVALVITTNLKFADWTQVFGDEQLIVALLDRLTHRAHIIEFIGDSYRFRERQRQGEGET